MLNQAKISLKWTFADPHPLMELHRGLLHDRACLHDISHLGNGNHAEPSRVDATHAARELLYVRKLVRLNIHRTHYILTLKHLQNHQWITIIQMRDQLVGQSHHKLPLNARLDFDPPEFGVHVGRQVDVPRQVCLLTFHHLVNLAEVLVAERLLLLFQSLLFLQLVLNCSLLYFVDDCRQRSRLLLQLLLAIVLYMSLK